MTKALLAGALVLALLGVGAVVWHRGRAVVQAPEAHRTATDSLLRLSDRARSEAMKAKSEDRDFLLGRLSLALSNAGQLQQAFDAAAEVIGPARRISALTSLVRASLRLKSATPKPSLMAQLALQALGRMSEEGSALESLDYDWALSHVCSALEIGRAHV